MFCRGKCWVHIWPLICPNNRPFWIPWTKNIAKNYFDFQFTNEIQVVLQHPHEVVIRSIAKCWPILMKLNHSKCKKLNISQIETKFSIDGRTHILTCFGIIDYYHIWHYFFSNYWVVFHQLDIKEYTIKSIWPRSWYFV